MKLKTYHDEIYVQYYSMLAPSTVPGYESSWQLYIEPKFGDWEIEDIRVRDINLWLTEFDSAGAARKAFKILRQIINAAIADEAYPDDVADPKFRAVRQPKMQPREKPRAMTPREINKLFRAVYGWVHGGKPVAATTAVSAPIAGTIPPHETITNGPHFSHMISALLNEPAMLISIWSMEVSSIRLMLQHIQIFERRLYFER